MDRMLKLTEVAEALRIGMGTARRLMQSGEIPGVRKVGRSWRVPESCFQEYMRPMGAVATKARPRPVASVRDRIRAKHGV